jgi:lipopolysaccharide/colanic/teichoic acid biosynthesis glycosyltransferase
VIRLFDVFFAALGLILISPFFLFIAIWIKLDSPGPFFFVQKRVGKGQKLFSLFKFRTMKTNAHKKGLLTVGKDPRITPSGHFLRKYKLDELPQLLNVLIGDMSLVGPRPEVRKFVNQYTDDQIKLLQVRPGITDPASIYYSSENEILANSSDPKKTYIHEILPNKLELSSTYAFNPSLKSYFKYIFLTIKKIFFGKA